jgi:hypothetical protein
LTVVPIKLEKDAQSGGKALTVADNSGGGNESSLLEEHAAEDDSAEGVAPPVVMPRDLAGGRMLGRVKQFIDKKGCGGPPAARRALEALVQPIDWGIHVKLLERAQGVERRAQLRLHPAGGRR